MDARGQWRRACSWVARYATKVCAMQLLVGAPSLALNLWNLVICSRALADSHGCSAQAFLVGSIICSTITLLGYGITVPLPHFVFAVLGLAWKLQASDACGAFTSSRLTSTIRQSLLVLWITFAANFIFLSVLYCCPTILVPTN